MLDLGKKKTIHPGDLPLVICGSNKDEWCSTQTGVGLIVYIFNKQRGILSIVAACCNHTGILIKQIIIKTTAKISNQCSYLTCQ